MTGIARDAVAETKADPNRSRREDELVEQIETLREVLRQLLATPGAEQCQECAIGSTADWALAHFVLGERR